MKQLRDSAIGALLLLSAAAPAAAQAADFGADAASLIRKYCLDCHGSEAPEAGIDLEQLTAAREFGANFLAWEKVAGMLGQRKMPPESMPQPSDRERTGIVEAIRGELDRFIKHNAGDPGVVVMRRLTSAEYAYTVEDLTGLDLPLGREFLNDAVGGEGFANVGQAQFMDDSTLERSLEAAKTVASHAVIGSGPLSFFGDAGPTGLELSAISRIQETYRRYGFRTGAGEGAEPFGLDQYPRAFYVTWQYRHREALGQSDVTLNRLAEAEGISARFADHIWTVLNESAGTFPASSIAAQWRALPAPVGDQDSLKHRVRDGCQEIYRQLRNWQTLLAASTADEEESAILTADALRIGPTHRFEARLDWPDGSRTALVELSVTPAGDSNAPAAIVLWKDAQIRFRQRDRRRSSPRPLFEVLTPASRQRLRFGRHPQRAPLDAADFALGSPTNLRIELEVPESATSAGLEVEVELDRERGGAPVRCTVTDGTVEGETAAESGGHSALLADPESESYDAWKAGVLEFARKLPEVSHREPAPSDRDPIPAAFDNTYNGAERNLFHYRIKYHRDDEFLVQHLLDDATRARLDQAWTDLLSSFEYHDACLQFVARKFALDLDGKGIAELDRSWISRLPEEPRQFIERLHEDYLAAQQSLKAAQPGHVEDALRFAERAWRRPLTEPEQTALRAFYNHLRLDAQLDHTQAMRALLARILTAPAFLYRLEPPVEQRGIVPLSNWELANRLSYFLWSSVPDDELRQAAETGRLQEPDELERQARRMLRDPKARRFATEFFGQWFGFYRFDEYQGIDARRFPEFTDALKTAMYNEAVSFFEHIVREDRPVDEILFADYSFLNRDLAGHYGIDADMPAAEPPLQVADLGRHERGGLLRLGAVLTVTSAPLRTSPVKRGDWILRRVLGTPVPPPPPDAGSIPADEVLADGRTVRERLEAHRREASCVNCHARMDPLGFALEHFDAIGRWRDGYSDGQPIDSTGVLNDGAEISGPDGLRRYLRQHQAQFHRTLCTKLLGYALGRAEIASDRPLIEQMTANLEGDSRFSTLVARVATSRQFRYRRGGTDAEPESVDGPAESKGADYGDR